MRLAIALLCALAGTAVAGDDDPLARARAAAEDLRFEEAARLLDPVSYTHLTLPTNREV